MIDALNQLSYYLLAQPCNVYTALNYLGFAFLAFICLSSDHKNAQWWWAPP